VNLARVTSCPNFGRIQDEGMGREEPLNTSMHEKHIAVFRRSQGGQASKDMKRQDLKSGKGVQSKVSLSVGTTGK